MMNEDYALSQQSDSDDFDEYSYNELDDYLDNERFPMENPCPESFNYRELDNYETECYLNKAIDAFCKQTEISKSVARLLLQSWNWDGALVKAKFLADPFNLLIQENIIPDPNSSPSGSDSVDVMSTLQTIQRLGHKIPSYFSLSVTSVNYCAICFNEPLSSPFTNESATFPQYFTSHRMTGLSCGHRFCTDCWNCYFELMINENIGFGIKCMSVDCDIIVVEDFLLSILKNSSIKKQYFDLLFNRMVQSNPSLKFCLGPNCPMVICALEEPKARRVKCAHCQTEFCFNCGEAYHAPTGCGTLRHWLVKCRDDSGTANYIAAHTKDCPACHVCIEKNEGCNHMRCSICKYEFCWVCLGDWNLHKVEYYACSRYDGYADVIKKNSVEPNRESLERYVFYYKRWENHAHSLSLEQEQLKRIQSHIDQKVMQKEGTWIDWQYLLTAANTLKNCRYTLKYTYPHAFYGNKLERKELFEYMQALLEAEVEDLSWKIEHAEITDRAELQNKMDVCEKHRITLLQEFLNS